MCLHNYGAKQTLSKRTLNDIIVFVWSQYDGGNIEQRTIG